MVLDLITIGSCTLDCMISINDILRFEMFDRNKNGEEIKKKYTAIEYSRKLNIDGVTFVPGGSAANIASDCSMLGLKSAYLGILGNDFAANICIQDLKSRGVDLSEVIQTDKDNTAFSVILRTEWGKDRSILAYKGANNLLQPSDIKENLFKDIKAFAWTSLTTENGCKAIDKAIMLTKNADGAVFAAPSMSIIKHNPEWAKILLGKSDVVSLNKEEGQEFTGKTDTVQMIRKFLKLGVKLISITDGPNGSIISDGNEIVNSAVFKGDVKDTTGAGDAFLSGLLVSYLNKFALEKTSKLATAMSFLECREVGVRVGMPTSLKELEQFVQENTIKQVLSQIV